MQSSSTKAAETTSYEAVCATPFTRIHGRPTRQDELIKKEASDLAWEVENITFTWSRDTMTGEEYGLLAEIIGDIEYTHLTNLNWTQEMEPVTYDPAITAATATHTRKRMEEEWEEKQESWFIRKGFLCGVTMNMRDALDEQYCLQLKHINTAYHNTTPIQILNHLDTRWCPLDVRTRKLLKAEFHTDWDSTVMHLTAFGMKLDKEQAHINRIGVVISGEDKLQFYMEQIYASNCFDKKGMVNWENKPVNIKDDYNEAKLYFEGLVQDFETYTQSSGGDSSKKGLQERQPNGRCRQRNPDIHPGNCQRFSRLQPKSSQIRSQRQQRSKSQKRPVSSNDSPNPSSHQHRCNAIDSDCSSGKRERRQRGRRRRRRAHFQICA